MQNKRAERRSELHPVPIPEWVWFEEARAKRTPDEQRYTDAYRRLMEAETILWDRWEQANGSEIRGDHVGLLLSLPVEPEDDDDLLWVLGLGEKVAALGGHLEVRAIFDDEQVVLMREPGSDGQPPII